MALNPITPGLRRFVNDSTEITRVDLRVPPGAELEVDEVVAMQLPGTFKDPAFVAERDAARQPRKAKRRAKDDDVELEAEPDA